MVYLAFNFFQACYNLDNIIVELLAYTAVHYCISLMYWRGIEVN